ncbi:hypothetical protein NFI96_020794, partial [Prochilodus magdalenae]
SKILDHSSIPSGSGARVGGGSGARVGGGSGARVGSENGEASGVQDQESEVLNESQLSVAVSLEGSVEDVGSDVGQSQDSEEMLYSVEQINTFLDETKRGSDRSELFLKLDQVLQSLSSEEAVVLGGDWNSTLSVKDRNGEEPHRQSALTLANVLSGFDLRDVWRDKHPAARQYSWVKDFFTAGALDQQCSRILLDDLPQSDGQHRQDLDAALSFDEVTKAVYQLTSGRAPGVDGLPIDFYKAFWGIIGRDFFDVRWPALVQVCSKRAVSVRFCLF